MRRLLGVLPLGFFGVTFAYYFESGQPEQVLWVCTMSNLCLGLGLLARSPVLVWSSALWLLIGAPLWFLDAVLLDTWLVHSFLTHIAALGIALWAVGDIPKRRVWWIAGLGFLGLQICTRVVGADPALNINIAFTVYGPLRPWIASYAVYWVMNGLMLASALGMLESVLRRWRRGVSTR